MSYRGCHSSRLLPLMPGLVFERFKPSILKTVTREYTCRNTSEHSRKYKVLKLKCLTSSRPHAPGYKPLYNSVVWEMSFTSKTRMRLAWSFCLPLTGHLPVSSWESNPEF